MNRVKRFLAYAAGFMPVWWVGCYLADYVFMIEVNAWSMSWGAITALLAYFVGIIVKNWASARFNWVSDAGHGKGCNNKEARWI